MSASSFKNKPAIQRQQTYEGIYAEQLAALQDYIRRQNGHITVSRESAAAARASFMRMQVSNRDAQAALQPSNRRHRRKGRIVNFSWRQVLEVIVQVKGRGESKSQVKAEHGGTIPNFVHRSFAPVPSAGGQ